MRKVFIFLLGIGLTSSVIFLFANSASAFSAREVLGDSTVQLPLSIPPTAEGPGLILPDSPLFFLDKIKQEVRIVLAFTSEEKAKVHAAIAGERLAELQFMLAKNNVSGIRTALQGVSDNLRKAADDLDSAKLSGRNINLLAKSINDSIKDKQEKLSVLETKATGEVKAQVAAAKAALRSAKVNVEDHLPEDLLINEVEDDLDGEIEDHINNATNSAKGINRAIDVLTKLASEAGKKDQERRQEALIKAVEVKNEALKKQQEKLIEADNKAQEKIAEAKKKALEKAKEAANKIDEAVKRFEEAKNEVSEIENTEENKEKSSRKESSENSSED